MKKILLFLCTMLCVNVLFAQDFYVNGVGYTINGDEVSVTGYDSNNLSNELEIPSTVEYYGNEYTVTFIQGRAFYNSNLTSVTIPNTVTAIGTSTDSYGAFEACYSLTSVTIPNSVTLLGRYTFWSCDNLTNINCLAETAPLLCNDVFGGTPSNKNLTYPCGSDYSSWENATSWGSVDCVENISSNLTYTILNEYSVSVRASSNNITTADIPERVIIGGKSYSVTTIEDNAFLNCSNLTSINCFAEYAPTIGNSAFEGTPSNKTLTYPCGSEYSVLENATSWSNVECIYLYLGSADNLTYKIISPTEVEVQYGYANIANIPETVTDGDKIYKVTSIGDCAFCHIDLTSVTIPNSVTVIRNSAFRDCSNLTSITIPNSVTYIDEIAFEHCNSLNQVTILNENACIDIDAFRNAGQEGEEVIMNDLKYKVGNYSVGNYNFLGTGLITFYIGEQAYYPNQVCVSGYTENLNGDLEIPSSIVIDENTYSVTAIDKYAFENCDSLTSITIPNSVTTIEYSAFSQCGGLLSVSIPNSVTYIGDNAFLNCISLTSINIPNSVTCIGSGVFAGCRSLTSVTIPNSVTSIEAWAFVYCSSLTSIDIPSSVTVIGNSAFAYCSSLNSVYMYSNNTIIPSDAFLNSGGLSSNGIVYIPFGNYTLEAGNYTFENPGHILFYFWNNYRGYRMNYDNGFSRQVAFCKFNISDVEIPSTAFGSSIVAIGDYAFYLNESVTSVTIPNSITSIGTSNGYFALAPNGFGASGVNDNLTSITCLGETAPILSDMAFGSNYTAPKTLNVPFGSNYSAWQNNICANIIKTNYLIQEGETKELANDFTINATTGLINEGVLKIKQGGQLINQTSENPSGIFEVETKTLPTDKWSFIGAPFAGYKLETVKQGSKDISVSTFDYNTGNWSNDWATTDTQIGAGEGFFAWSWEEEPTIFTTYGNGAEEYNYEQTPTYTLNNQDVTVTKDLTTHQGGGNWMALSNPYTFKLDVSKFLQDQTGVKGGVIYKFNGETWDDVNTGAIDLTEGFFINYNNDGNQIASFVKSHRHTGAKSTTIPITKHIKLYMQDGERTSKLMFAQNEQASQGDDKFDANKLFSPMEITEPYFVTEGNALLKEEVKELPYLATLNIKSYESKEISIHFEDIPEGMTITLIDGEQSTRLNEGEHYTTNITTGENEDRFKILFGNARTIQTTNTNDITITNNNRQVNITTIEKDLLIEVYNTIGQKVLTTQDYKFQLNEVPAGVYMIKAFNKQAYKTTKIVVE